VCETTTLGECTLRAAIQQANFNSGADIINFDIPGLGPHTIQPFSALPTITEQVIIDGYTQPGASPNTNGPGLGLNTVLKIELDGSAAGAANGLKIVGNGGTTVRGLAINRFAGALGGILLSSNGPVGGGPRNVIEGNFIGTDVTGTIDLGNAPNGVNMVSRGNYTVGGTTAAARNLISGNTFFGVQIGSGAGQNNIVQGNLIGTDISGTTALGNSSAGVSIVNSTNNVIGGTASEAGNTIAFNGGEGVFIRFDPATNNAVLSNSIFSNFRLGIDLGAVIGCCGDGVTPNDVGDGDTGTNNLQNFPVFTAESSGSGTIIDGILNSTINTNYRVEFFSNSVCDPSGYGEGESFIGFTNGVTDPSGNVNFPVVVPPGQFVTATSTDSADNTSEFSQWVEVVSGTPAVLQIKLSPQQAVNPVGTSHTVTATVTQDGKPVAGLLVTFTVTSGPNTPQTFTATTDANGNVSFTYPGTSAGTDVIVATVADSSGAVLAQGEVVKKWQGETPPPHTSYLYPVKFVCGSITEPSDGMAANEPPVKPGNYATAINIQNVFPETATLTYRTSVARAVDPNVTTGPVSPPASAKLEEYQAMEIDCPQILGLLEEAEFAKTRFLKGFVAIESGVDLQVAAVYTAQYLGPVLRSDAVEIILNTGFDQSTGTLLADGAEDDDWDVTGGVVATPPPSPTDFPFAAVVVNQSIVSSEWGTTAPLPDSRWVSTDDQARALIIMRGEEFTYEFGFNLPSQVQNPSLDLTIRADQEADLFLNGNLIGSVPNYKHKSLQPVTVTTTDVFKSGPNILTVIVKETFGVVPTLGGGIIGGIDVVGTVQAFNPGGGGGVGMSIDVEYVQPKLIQATNGGPAELGHIIVDKVTDPAGDPQSFDFTASFTTDFSLTDVMPPLSGGL